jgi:hypothetical protein
MQFGYVGLWFWKNCEKGCRQNIPQRKQHIFLRAVLAYSILFIRADVILLRWGMRSTGHWPVGMAETYHLK